MALADYATLKQQMMDEDPQFAELVLEHGGYEERLQQLARLEYPSYDEQMEEQRLKKKKLMVRDLMEEKLSGIYQQQRSL